jgi:hypothetical protein
MNSVQPIDIIPSIDTTEWGVLYEDGSCKWFDTEQEAIAQAKDIENDSVLY